VSNQKTGLEEEVTISVEKMMRFCILEKMQSEHAGGDTGVLPLHLTRFGTLLLETSSFLYSLFEDRSDSINLLSVWSGFDHPFGSELQQCASRLNPFRRN
jgi:hypothetical protein